MKKSLLAVGTTLLSLAVFMPAFASGGSDRVVTQYSQTAVSDCTGESVQYNTTAVMRTVSNTSQKGSREKMTINLSSEGYGLTSGIRYKGRERARIVTKESSSGAVDMVIRVEIDYTAQGQAPDFISHQFVHIFQDAAGNFQILAEESSSECR